MSELTPESRARWWLTQRDSHAAELFHGVGPSTLSGFRPVIWARRRTAGGDGTRLHAPPLHLPQRGRRARALHGGAFLAIRRVGTPGRDPSLLRRRSRGRDPGPRRPAAAPGAQFGGSE